MHVNHPFRTRPPRGGRLTLGTFILAAASAVSLVMLSGCHAASPAQPRSGFVANDAEKAHETRLLHPVESMKPLQPFDEGFVVIDDSAP